MFYQTKLSFLVLILFVFASSASKAQDLNADIFRYDGANGLSQNTVNHVIQDKEGFLWISTQDGLNKFDGYGFEVHRHNPVKKSSLSSNYINMVCLGADNMLWIATLNGLNKYDPFTNEYQNYSGRTMDKETLHNGAVNYIFRDSKNTIWIKTKYGLSRYNPKTDNFTFFRHLYYEFSYSTEYNNFKMIETEKRFLWVATKDGIARFDKENEQFSYFYPEGEDAQSKNEIFDISNEDKNVLWVAASEGLYRFNYKENKFIKIQFHSERQRSAVHVLFKDNQNLLWIGTDHGLAYLDKFNNTIRFYQPTDADNNAIVFGRVSSITQDAAHILWVGTENGLFKIDRKVKTFNTIRRGAGYGPQLSNNRIYSVFVDEKERVWLGTRQYGLNIYDPKTGNVKVLNSTNSNLKDDDIHCIQRLSNGKICIGTSNGAFFYLPEKEDFISFSKYFKKDFSHRFTKNRISKIILDQKGQYWFATNNGLFFFDGNEMKTVADQLNLHSSADFQTFNVIERRNGEIWAASTIGLTRINPQTGEAILYTKENGGLSNNSALTVFESRDNTLWCGTETGLNKYLAIKDSFVFYTTDSHKFNNDYVYSVLESDDGNLWLSTNNGLVRFSPKTEQVKNFHIEDGLQSIEFNIGAAYKHANGIMYFGGVNGVNFFDPMNLPSYTYAPKPVITRFEKMLAEGNVTIQVHESDTMQLQPHERSFTIRFTIPEYTHPLRNSYRYRIKELDEEWVTSNSNFVSYNRLRPGKYTFQVMGANSNNVWNPKPAELVINIEIPFWESRTAYVIFALTFVALIVLIFMLYSRKMRREKRFFIVQKEASDKLIKQGDEIKEKTKSIEDSMHYAKRIINAMIPSDKFFKRIFPKSFILFMPKDIVSGDFFWMDTKDDLAFVAVADCTGHGVPGAFMSIVGLDLLRDILSLGIETPAEILDRLNNEVTKIFKSKDNGDAAVKDGMDIVICAIDKKKRELQFAGAMNPLYVLRNNEIVEIKGDRFSIGPQSDDTYRNFTNHVVPLQKDDVIYMFSDGYADQFGGMSEKKFKIRRFRHLLLNIWNHDFEYQKLTLLETFHNWKQDHEQVDDVIVLGLKPLA